MMLCAGQQAYLAPAGWAQWVPRSSGYPAQGVSPEQGGMMLSYAAHHPHLQQLPGGYVAAPVPVQAMSPRMYPAYPQAHPPPPPHQQVMGRGYPCAVSAPEYQCEVLHCLPALRRAPTCASPATPVHAGSTGLGCGHTRA